MLIQFNAKYKCGDLVFDKYNNRLRVISLRYDLTPSSQDVFYYCRNILMTDSSAYHWFTEEALSGVHDVPHLPELPELPF